MENAGLGGGVFGVGSPGVGAFVSVLVPVPMVVVPVSVVPVPVVSGWAVSVLGLGVGSVGSPGVVVELGSALLSWDLGLGSRPNSLPNMSNLERAW